MIRRTIIYILSLLVLTSAFAADAQRTKRTKRTSTKRTAVAKPKQKKSAPTISPEQKAKNDSIEAARLLQLRLDSVAALEQRVAQADMAAINQLALWYYDGHIVSQNFSKAAELWRQGAELSDVLAMEQLARCYRLGQGVERDEVEAARLYTRSICGGNGSLLKRCIDTAPDDTFAALLVGDCYRNGDGVKHDAARAAQYYANAADKGSVPGMLQAGLCYAESGDTSSALRYFEMGADHGDALSKYWAAHLLLADDASLPRAVPLLRDAAQSGIPQAQNSLGELYAQGRGTPRDIAEAVRLFKLAADQGSPKGLWNYALAHRDGTGVKLDFSDALTMMADALALDSEGTINSDITTESKGLFATYVDGMRAVIANDITTALTAAKVLDKAKMPEGKIIEALAAASIANHKVDPKKAAKILSKLAPTSAEAAYYLTAIASDGTPAPIVVKKAVDGYRGNDHLTTALTQ